MNLQKNIRIKPLFSWDEQGDIAKIASILAQGKILAGHSDTVYGLLTKVGKGPKRALDRIKRRKDKPYLVLVSQRSIADKIDNEKCLTLAAVQKQLWPGPLTVITDLKGFDPSVYSEQGLVALRVPDHKGLQALIALTGPLFSTSANVAGEVVPQDLDQLDEQIACAVDGFITSDTAKIQASTSSTIIKLIPSGYEVIREGAVSAERLQSLLS